MRQSFFMKKFFFIPHMGDALFFKNYYNEYVKL